MKPAGKACEGEDIGEGELEDRGRSGQCPEVEPLTAAFRMTRRTSSNAPGPTDSGPVREGERFESSILWDGKETKDSGLPISR